MLCQLKVIRYYFLSNYSNLYNYLFFKIYAFYFQEWSWIKQILLFIYLFIYIHYGHVPNFTIFTSFRVNKYIYLQNKNHFSFNVLIYLFFFHFTVIKFIAFTLLTLLCLFILSSTWFILLTFRTCRCIQINSAWDPKFKFFKHAHFRKVFEGKNYLTFWMQGIYFC